jgi:hypothetical protein
MRGYGYYLNKLRQLDIPAPTAVENSVSQGDSYLFLTYLEGEEIGAVYQTLCAEGKRAIAREVVPIQKKAANMALLDMECDTDYVDICCTSCT